MKKKLIKFLSNEHLIESLCKSLENKMYDEVLIRNVTQELKVCLEKCFYFKFIKSGFYESLIDVMRKNEVCIFSNGLNLDEQFKYVIDLIGGKVKQDFIKPNIPIEEKVQQQQQQQKSKSKSRLNESSTSKKYVF